MYMIIYVFNSRDLFIAIEVLLLHSKPTYYYSCQISVYNSKGSLFLHATLLKPKAVRDQCKAEMVLPNEAHELCQNIQSQKVSCFRKGCFNLRYHLYNLSDVKYRSILKLSSDQRAGCIGKAVSLHKT